MSAVHQDFPIVLTDLSGGMVDGEHPARLEPNQFENCINLYSVGQKLRGRPGYLKVSTAGAFGQNLNSFCSFRPDASNWGGATNYLMVGSDVGFGYLSGAAFTSITAALPSSSDPWHMRQYKGVVYAAREQTLRADSVLRRVTLTTAGTAGIAAPATAPVSVQGAAGVLAAGAYTYVYTYYNSTTGAESNPSPASAPLTIAASKKIDLSSITSSANAQVNARRIYRSLIDQSGIYYLVATIPDNANQLYSDNISEDALGDAASNDNALPPEGLAVLEEGNERLWAAGESNVYYSRALFPESWPAGNLIQVGPDDNQIIRALLWDGQSKRLLVGKTGSIWEITGTSAANFRLELVTSKHGVIGSHGMATAEGIVFFFSGKNVYAISPGGRDPQSISTVAVRRLIDAISVANLKKVRLSTYTRYSWLIVQIPTTTGPRTAIYDYKTGAWFDWTGFGGASDTNLFLAEGQDGNFDTHLYAVYNSASHRHVYELTDAAYTDGAGATDGADINVSFTTKAFSADGRLLTLKDIGVMGSFIRDAGAGAGPYNVLLVASLDAYSVTASRTLELPSAVAGTAGWASLWKRARLNTLQKPATYIQIQVVANNQPAVRLEFSGLALNCKVLNRRRNVA